MKAEWRHHLDDARASLTDAIALLEESQKVPEKTSFLLSDIHDAKVALQAALDDPHTPAKQRESAAGALAALQKPATDEEAALLHALSLLE